jgi:hypothetical protein
LAARSDKSVCHSSYVDDMGRKSATIKVKDPLNKGLLLDRAQLALLLVEGLDCGDALRRR